MGVLYTIISTHALYSSGALTSSQRRVCCLKNNTNNKMETDYCSFISAFESLAFWCINLTYFDRFLFHLDCFGLLPNCPNFKHISFCTQGYPRIHSSSTYEREQLSLRHIPLSTNTASDAHLDALPQQAPCLSSHLRARRHCRHRSTVHLQWRLLENLQSRTPRPPELHEIQENSMPALPPVLSRGLHKARCKNTHLIWALSLATKNSPHPKTSPIQTQRSNWNLHCAWWPSSC